MYKIALAKKIVISLFLLVLFSKPTAAAEKPEIFVQLGHTDQVTSVAFSPDGRYALSGSDDSTLKLWEVATGKEIRAFIGHKSSVVSGVFSSDGRYALSGGGRGSMFDNRFDPTIRLWDISSGKEIRTFTGHARSITSVAFSPDGRYALSGSKDGTLKLWDIATGKEIRTFTVQKDTDISVAFSPDGKYGISADNYQIILWELATGKEIRRFEGSNANTNAIFSPDGKYALSVYFEKLILWDVETGKKVRTFEGHFGYVRSIVFSPDGRYVLSGSWGKKSDSKETDGDNTVRLWDISTGKEIRSFRQTGGVTAVSFSPDGKYVLSGSRDKAPKLWDIETGKEVRQFTGHTGGAPVVSLSHDGRYVLTSSDKVFNLWDVFTGRSIRTFTGHTDYIICLAFSPDGLYALSGSGEEDKTLKLWDIATGKEIRTFTGHTSYVSSVSFSPDGRYVLSESGDKTLRLWDISTGRQIWTVQITNEGSFSFSRDGGHILAGYCNRDPKGSIYCESTTIKLFDTLTGREIRTFSPKLNDALLTGVYSITLSPDGRYALTGALGLWEISSGRLIRSFKKVDQYYKAISVAFSPDGMYVISGNSMNGDIDLWDVATGGEIKALRGHNSSVGSVTFSPDGKYVFSGSGDNTARIWDISTGKEIAQFISFTDREWIVITPEGYYNSSANGDKHLNVRIGNNVYGIENYREAFYRPDLVKVALSGGSLKDFKTLADVKQPPVVTIVDTPKNTNKDEATVTLKVVDIGGGIGDIRLYLNGSAVILDSSRGVKIVASNQNEVLKTYNLKLSNGLNTIRAIAFNAENTMQSNDVLHEITASFKSLTKPSLNAIIVGINEYKNPKLQLKYAVSDAELFEDTLKKVTAGLFEKVNIIKLVTKEETTNENIMKELKAYKALNPDDVFVFFVASHGTVDDGEYFLITSNVGSTRTEKLKTDALPQGMLKELIANIPATKKLIIIDTCSAGALGEAIQVAMLTRGMSEDTAMKILSRAVGSTILSASTSLQEAVEGYQGHGLFTYVLVEGLKGKADKGKTGYVKTTELADYVDSEVPVLAEKVFKKAQYPTISISGQAFPIGKVR
ncbi:MAG: caspase family protein [Thermodesulfovibrionales bacterium]